MRYRLAIFDFDGTLADSFPFFVSVFNELAMRHRFRSIDLAEVERLRR
jgi:phosphoglycolate phosphatase